MLVSFGRARGAGRRRDRLAAAPLSLSLGARPPGRGALAWSAFAEDHAALAEVVGAHLDMDPVADHRADAEAPHLAGGVGDDPVIVVEPDAEAAVGEDLVDQPLDGEDLFLRQDLARLEVDGGGLAVRAGLEIVADPLVLVQPGKAGGLNRADVDEGVVAARIVGDEAVAAIVIE